MNSCGIIQTKVNTAYMRQSIKFVNISFDELSEGVKQDFLAWVHRKFELYPSYQELDADTQARYLQMYVRECKGVLVATGTITKTGWQCPACGVGVRGDVKVCPNCVKQVKRTNELPENVRRIIREYPYLHSLGLIDENGDLKKTDGDS